MSQNPKERKKERCLCVCVAWLLCMSVVGCICVVHQTVNQKRTHFYSRFHIFGIRCWLWMCSLFFCHSFVELVTSWLNNTTFLSILFELPGFLLTGYRTLLKKMLCVLGIWSRPSGLSKQLDMFTNVKSSLCVLHTLARLWRVLDCCLACSVKSICVWCNTWILDWSNHPDCGSLKLTQVCVPADFRQPSVFYLMFVIRPNSL